VCTSTGEASTNGHKEKIYTAEFSAVYSGSPENDQFFKWTPSLSLKTGTIKQQKFEVNKEYYLDFTLVEP
jgi:hypothetical protein